MPESVTDRPTNSYEHVFLLTKDKKYFYDAEAVREPHISDGKGGFSNKQTLKSVLLNAKHKPSLIDAQVNPAGRNLRNVWTIATEPTPEAHFATFPKELVKKCILAGSKTGDTILDPFSGSGKTLIVSKKYGRKAIGIDLKQEYLEMPLKKIAQEVIEFT